MESLMRFGRTGCVAVLKHFNEWIAQNDADPDVSRNQIAYAKVAKDLWFSSPKHRVLQDLWNNRVKNKDPTRGCLRKVISMVVMVGSDIRLKRKKKWFCEARRHAGKHSHMLSRHSQLYDDREIGDRNELVLFSSPGDQSELDVVFESVYSEASKLFTNNRTKDQAVILAAFLQKLCYYPVRGIHSANWLGRKKKELKKKIDLCHEKRDDARKKLAECLARKKELKTKIALAKKKSGSSSLAQMIQEDSDINDELEGLQALLRKMNEKWQEGSADFLEIGSALKRLVDELQARSAEEADIQGEMAAVDEKEAADTEGGDEMQNALQDALGALRQIDRQSDAAKASARAAEAAVDRVMLGVKRM